MHAGNHRSGDLIGRTVDPDRNEHAKTVAMFDNRKNLVWNAGMVLLDFARFQRDEFIRLNEQAPIV